MEKSFTVYSPFNRGIMKVYFEFGSHEQINFAELEFIVEDQDKPRVYTGIGNSFIVCDATDFATNRVAQRYSRIAKLISSKMPANLDFMDSEIALLTAIHLRFLNFLSMPVPHSLEKHSGIISAGFNVKTR